MKKFVALLLVLAMVLSLCTTAFAGSAAETAVLRLTGDAADEVVNLKDGQRVSAGQDVAVRLNVQSDPGAAEYTVTLDGEAVEADHSTAQYHFYYLPAEQLTGVSTLSVSTQALETGSGTAADPYKIATAADLKAFRDKVNSGSTGLCAVLTADIALDKSETWTPIGNSSKLYNGTFDGAGHTISGISIPSGTSDSGLFGCTAKSTTAPVIKNLTIADSTIVTTGYAGGIVGYGGGVLENCHTSDDVTVQGKKYAGGIVGNFVGQYAADMLTMTQCSNRASVTETQGYNGYAGGLIGGVSMKLTLTKSFNAGAVISIPGSQMHAAGGLIGQASMDTTLTDVYNVGDISVANAGNAVGGLIGTNSGKAITVTNAYQHGTVANNAGNGGAIMGMVTGTNTLKNVYKTGTLADTLSGSLTGKATTVTEDALKAAAANLGGEFTNDLSGDAAVNNGFPILLWQNPVSSAADALSVVVGSEESKIMLDSEEGTDPAAPAEKTLSIASENLSSFVADRVYLSAAADNSGTVELGLTLSEDGTLGDKLTRQTSGYTADTLYFYRTPAAVERTVYAIHTVDGTPRYYKLTIQRTAYTGTRYGAVSADWRDDSPVLNTTYDAASGYLVAAVNVGRSFASYLGGAATGTMAKYLLTYDPEFKYYAYDASAAAEDGSQTLRFARVGRYWMSLYPDTNGYSAAPGAVWWGSQEVADKYIAAANALKQQEGYAALPAALRTAFENAVKAVSDGWNENTAKPLYLNAAGGMTTEKTDLLARDAMGAPMTGEYKLEQQENLMLDYMDVVKTYLADSDLGTLKYQALSTVQRNLGTGKLAVVKIMDIKTDADRTAYNTYRSSVWGIVNASDISGINENLTKLGLGKLKLDVVSEKAQVIVGSKTYDLELTGGGATADTAKTVTVTAERGSGEMQRIYLTRTENMTVPDSMEGILGKGYTTSFLYFYDTPAAQTKSFTVSVTENGAAAYYTIVVQLPAKSGTALGPNGMGYKEDSPGGMSSFNGDTGYIYGTVQSGPMIFGGMKLHTDGKSSGDSIAPDWAALETSTNKLYYLSGTQANFGRPGYYWIPVSDGTNTGLLPVRASIQESDLTTILSKVETAAAAEGVSAEAKAMLESAAASVKNRTVRFSAQLYLNTDGSIPTDSKQRTAIQARSCFGAYLYGDSLYEKELNTVLDLTAICAAWGENADLAAQRFEAYQRILNMKNGIHACIDIQSAADRDTYQNIRQAKWNVIHAADLTAINAVLTGLDLEAITPAEPEVILGDLTGDGEIDVFDLGLLLQYVKGLNDNLTDAQLKAADITGDGEVDVFDLGIMLQYVKGLRDTLN